MDTVRDVQVVEVDQGDLLEGIDAANAWANHLRVRGGVVKQSEAADRIDQAVSRLRGQSFESVHQTYAPTGRREWN